MPNGGGGWRLLVCSSVLDALHVTDGGFVMMLLAGVSATLVDQHAYSACYYSWSILFINNWVSYNNTRHYVGCKYLRTTASERSHDVVMNG